jgi:GH35 family endo-1,4-beta-xylanase
VTVYGSVLTSDGVPVAGCYIGLSDRDYREITHVVTDANGHYEARVAEGTVQHLWAGKSSNGLYDLIPQTASASAGRRDFVLRPGANLAIEAYDESGKALTNEEYRVATASKVFITDLADMPIEGYFGAVEWLDPAEGRHLDWDDAQPAFIVAPGLRYKLHVQWELPAVGKLLFTLDNEGRGYRIDQSGDRLDLNLNVEIARSSLAALRRAAAAEHGMPEIERSEALLRSGETLLAAGDTSVKEGVAALAASVAISLEAHERLLIARAQESIERHRKGNVEIALADESGNPLEGARVSYVQTGRDFLFGANPLGFSGSFDDDVASLMQAAGINQSHVTVRWGLLEQAEGEFDWRNMQEFQQVDAQLAKGMQLMGALSLWFSPISNFRPDYLQAMSFSQLREATYRYAYELAHRFAGRIEIWEVNELNLASANALDLDLESRIELGRVFAQAVKDANPSARILNGSTALPFEFADSRPLRDVLRDGAGTDIIGLELYYSGVNTAGHAMVGLDLVSLSRTLDHYADFGKPVLVKEFSAPSIQVDGSSWWHRPWDEQNQADYATKVYTLAFGNPMVDGISWSWGVSDADAFIHGGGVLDRDFQPKPAYFALQKLLDSWTTRGSATTDDSGRVAFRGFAGDYTIRVEPAAGDAFETTLRLAEGQDLRVAIESPDSIFSVASAELSYRTR